MIRTESLLLPVLLLAGACMRPGPAEVFTVTATRPDLEDGPSYEQGRVPLAPDNPHDADARKWFLQLTEHPPELPSGGTVWFVTLTDSTTGLDRSLHLSPYARHGAEARLVAFLVRRMQPSADNF